MEITNKKYNELLEAERVLNALYATGVDNWDGWDATLEFLNETRKAHIPLDIGEK